MAKVKTFVLVSIQLGGNSLLEERCLRDIIDWSSCSGFVALLAVRLDLTSAIRCGSEGSSCATASSAQIQRRNRLQHIEVS